MDASHTLDLPGMGLKEVRCWDLYEITAQSLSSDPNGPATPNSCFGRHFKCRRLASYVEEANGMSASHVTSRYESVLVIRCSTMWERTAETKALADISSSSDWQDRWRKRTGC